jgi:histidine phosphotransferase ChpT
MTAPHLMPQTGGFGQSDNGTGAPCDTGQCNTAQTDLELIALLGSRLCHDLISPMGAIGNGVELMAMSGGPMSPELQLIAQSVNAANARLKFFRVAFGQASPDQRLGAPEIRNLLRDMAQTGRLTYDWRAEGDHARRVVKLCFLSLLCFETALPWGGADQARSRNLGHAFR